MTDKYVLPKMKNSLTTGIWTTGWNKVDAGRAWIKKPLGRLRILEITSI